MTVGLEQPLFDDRYRLEQLLGGGSSEVYRGTDVRLGRPVVVKVARAGSAEFDPARFENEMMLLAGLRHPGLVTLYDAGAVGDRAYLVMQYVAGGSLAERLRSGALTPEEVRLVGAALADALAYLHEHQVIHRDLKPGNVLLGEDGGVYLADFGIARTVDSARVTVTGLVVGTPAYLAPEQVRGRDITPACDLYALGLILLECLTGHREYTGAPIEAAVARLHRPPVVPPELPPPWPLLLAALTAEEASARPTARQVAAELSDPDAAAGRTAPLPLALPEPVPPQTAPAQPAPPAPARPPRRHGRAAAAVMAAAAVLAASGAVVLAAAWHGGQAPPLTPSAPTTAQTGQPARTTPASTAPSENRTAANTNLTASRSATPSRSAPASGQPTATPGTPPPTGPAPTATTPPPTTSQPPATTSAPAPTPTPTSTAAVTSGAPGPVSP